MACNASFGPKKQNYDGSTSTLTTAYIPITEAQFPMLVKATSASRLILA